MADMEDLNIQSNAELRAKPMSQGLANISLTDNISLTSLADVTPSPKKSFKRRHTLQTLVNSVAPVTADKERRTLAVARRSTEATETERRSRMAEKITKQPASLVPKQTCRKSNTNTALPSIEDRDVTIKLETKGEQIQPPAGNLQNEETLEDDSVIVLESNGEEDEKMLKAPALASGTSQSAIGAGVSCAYDYLNSRYSRSQYESAFVGNLSHLRAEKIRDRCIPYTRRLSKQARCKPHAPRSLRPEDSSWSVGFSNWINSFDEKFGLESIIFLSVVVLILIGLYNIFY